MHIYLASQVQSPDLTFPVLERIAEAIQYQLYQHVAPLWQGDGVAVTPVSAVEAIPNDDGACPIVVFGDADEPGALGWHTYGHTKHGWQIYGALFLNPILQNGGSILDGSNSLSVTASHEAIEAMLDPYVNDYSFVDAKTLEPKEGCDRVEGDSYVIGGVSVSNFLGPRAFRDGPGPYDYMGTLKKPWEVRPGGYCVRVDVTTGEPKEIFGDRVPEWKKALKARKLAEKIGRVARRLPQVARP